MSRQDKLTLPEIDDVLPNTSDDDDRLQIELRLRLDAVAAAEAERLSKRPRGRPNRMQLTRLAYHIYKSRCERSQVFDDTLFREPAWDMLLALYCLPRRGEVLTVTSLCVAAGVPQATGLRWQQNLIDEGLIQRCSHSYDGRLVLIGLTNHGRLLMDDYLAKLFACGSLVSDSE